MRLLILLLINLITSTAWANSNCKIANLDTVVLGWTGNCTEGLADGYGILKFRDNDPVKTSTYIGYFAKGVASGPLIYLGHQSTLAVIQYFNSGKRDDRFPYFFIDVSPDASLTNLSSKVFYDDVTKDSKGNPVSIPYQSAINSISAYVSSKNTSDTEFKLFKGLLEGNVRVSGEDDPPVLGAALKPSAGSKKKK